MIRGIGIDGVVSEIGCLTKSDRFIAKREELTKSLMRRYKAEDLEAERAINHAIDCGAIYQEGSNICLSMETNENLLEKICPFCGKALNYKKEDYNE